jgi:hypothetical protein
MPDTTGRPGRHVPAEVKRTVRARQGGRCAVPFCDNSVYLEHAHLKAHRLGGSREADNLPGLCRKHHDQLDKGYIRFSGTVDQPKFTTYDDRDLSQRAAPPGKTDGWKDPPNGPQRSAPGAADPP